MITWYDYQMMEQCQKDGLAKAIGISNFTITMIDRLLKTATTVPAVNQVESHPYFQQKKLKEYCDIKGERKDLSPSTEYYYIKYRNRLRSLLTPGKSWTSLQN